MKTIDCVVLVIGIAVLVTFYWRMIRCLHAWDLVDKTDFDPPIHTYVQTGGHRNHFGYLSESQIEDMSRRTVVLILRCNKCGAARIEKIKG